MQKFRIEKAFMTRILLVVSIGLFANLAKGQQDPPADLLIGSWTFMESASIDKMPVDIQQNLAGSAELQNHVAVYFSGRQLLFNTDGTYTISFSDGQGFNGQWSLSGNSLTTITNGVTATQQIEFVNNVHFYLVSESFTDPEARLLFPELHFTKN